MTEACFAAGSAGLLMQLTVNAAVLQSRCPHDNGRNALSLSATGLRRAPHSPVSQLVVVSRLGKAGCWPLAPSQAAGWLGWVKVVRCRAAAVCLGCQLVPARRSGSEGLGFLALAVSLGSGRRARGPAAGLRVRVRQALAPESEYLQKQGFPPSAVGGLARPRTLVFLARHPV